jgi:hypothetical protein
MHTIRGQFVRVCVTLDFGVRNPCVVSDLFNADLRFKAVLRSRDASEHPL